MRNAIKDSPVIAADSKAGTSICGEPCVKAIFSERMEILANRLIPEKASLVIVYAAS
jgi:hypothetical protein